MLVLDSDGKRVAVKYYDAESQELSEQLAFEKSLYAKTSRTNARGEGASARTCAAGVSWRDAPGHAFIAYELFLGLMPWQSNPARYCLLSGSPTPFAPPPLPFSPRLPPPPTRTTHDALRAHSADACICRLAHSCTAEIIMFDNVIVVYKFIGDLMFFVVGDAEDNELVLNIVLTALTEAIGILVRSGVERRTLLENLDLVLLVLDEIVDGGNVLETDPGIVASRVAMRGAEDTPIGEQSFSQALGSAREQLARALLK